jgi:hypothetical protein
MYRDGSTALDEHDRAVGAILIGEAMITQCERAVAYLRDPQAVEKWRAVREIHDDYPEIWRQFDRAQRVLASRGINTAGYDELRPHVRPHLASTVDDLYALDTVALEDARRAMDELKLVVPGADWVGIEDRTRDLVRTPRLRRSHWVAIAATVTAFVLSVLIYGHTITPVKKLDPDVVMRRQVADIAAAFKLRIEQLKIALGDRCDQPIARELMKQLINAGQGDQAKEFADSYIVRCGSDPIVAQRRDSVRLLK